MLKIYRTVQEAVKDNHNSLKGLFCYIKESKQDLLNELELLEIKDLENAGFKVSIREIN